MKHYFAIRQCLRSACLLLLLTLVGCTNELVVDADFPPPLVDPLPQTIGLYFDDEFRRYTHTEDTEDRSKWVITSGPAQVELFNQVLPHVFNQAHEIPYLPTADNPVSVDLVLHPQVNEFQYAIPRETKFKVFEVWIKYNLTAMDPEGNLIADWIVTAYGKTPTAFMQSDEDAMDAAIEVALRDLGANLSIAMPRVPELKHWLDNHPATQAARMAEANGS
jgi:hypothetical protein